MTAHGTAPVALLNWDGSPQRVIQEAQWTLEDRADSTNRLTIVTSLAEADGVRSEQEVIFKGRRFAVAEGVRTRSDGKGEFQADEVQAELASRVLKEFKANSWTLQVAVGVALDGTQWTIGELNPVRYGRSHFEDITVLDALKFLARHQDSKLTFDSLRRRVSITADPGTVHEVVFTYGRQLTDIVKEEIAPQTTVIHPTGADDMTISSVNGGVSYVEDYGYYTAQGISLADARARFKKEEYWEDSRYEVKENLLRDAKARLAVEAYPQITYTLTAAATVAVDGQDDFDLADIHLGDQVYVWDQEIDAKLRAEVVEVTTSSDASENRLTLAYLPDSLGSSSEGGFKGDSGRPADGPNQDRSVPQPRPSMPILEDVTNLGSGVVRWNGQDENGDYDTIPERFGTVETVVAKLVGGAVPSPDSEDAFSGTVIRTRGGGTSTVSFGSEGEFAVWFYMVGRDAITRSEYSEALVVEVPELVDTSAINERIDTERDRITEADERLTEGQGELDGKLDDLEERKAERDELTSGLADVYSEAEARAQELADSVVNQAASAAQEEYDRLQAIAERALASAGDNVIEDGSFETDLWPSRWDGGNGYAVTSVARSHAPRGERVLFVDAAERTGNFEMAFNPEGSQYGAATMSVTPGDVIRIAVRYRGTGSTFWLRLLDVTSSLSGLEHVELDPTSEWQRGVLTVTIPDGVTAITGSISARFGSGYVEFDHAEMRDITSAYESLIIAEQARQQAEDALAKAGDAESVAASAQDTASGKSTIYWSLSAPSGTGSDGDTWFRYTNLSGSSQRTVSGIWHWDGAVWSEDELSEEVVGQINIGTGTYGSMSGDRLEAESIRTRHLSAGPEDNLWRGESDLRGSHQSSLSSADWYVYQGSLSRWERATDITMRGSANAVALRDLDNVSRLVHRGSTITVTPGQEYLLEGAIRYDTTGFSDTNWGIVAYRVVWRDAQGSQLRADHVEGQTATGSQEVSSVLTAPEQAREAIVEFRGTATGPGRVRFWPPKVRSVVGNVQIGNGAITSPKVDTAEFFAAEAVIQKIWTQIVYAKMLETEGIITEDMIATGAITTPKLTVTEAMAAQFGQFIELEAGFFKSNEIRSMSVIGGTVEGATLRGNLFETSSQSQRGLKLDDTGMRVWDSSGNLRFDLSASSGNMTATGTWRTDFSGSRVQIEDDGAGGRVEFYKGGHRGRLKLLPNTDRLEMVYNDFSDPNQERPNVGVQQSLVSMRYRSTAITLGGTSGSDQYMRFNGQANFVNGISMRTSSRAEFTYGGNNPLAMLGQRPESGNTPEFEIRSMAGRVSISGSTVYCSSTHEQTTSSGANMNVDSSGRYRRSSSASRYKLEQQELSVPESILDIPLKDWIDKGATEEKAAMDAMARPFHEMDQAVYDSINLRRIPGVVAEDVEAHGGEQFVVYGPDGQTEEVMYDRLWGAQIQVETRQRRADVAELWAEIDGLKAQLAAQL